MILQGLNNDERQFDFLDLITVASFILQTLDYEATIAQASNNDLMREMRTQDSAYLQKIIEQNEKIINLLSNEKRNSK